MATVNFIRYKSQSKTALCKVTQYVEREDKNMADGERQLASGQNCTPRSAYREFLATREMYHKESPIWFYHYTQSFSPKENITPRQAHELAKEFAARAWPDSEVLVSTHLDAAHIHSHFIVNAVCHETGKMLRQGPETLKHLRKISDELCMKHGYSVLSSPQKRSDGMSAREYRSATKGESRGYKVRWEPNRKNITYTTPDGWQCRDRKLFGEKYLKEMMEFEFSERTKIIYGRTHGEEPSRADERSDPRVISSSIVYRGAVSDAGRTGETGSAVGATGEQVRMAGEVSERAFRSPVFLSDPNADGGTTEVATALENGGRTGWEEEREACLSSQIQTAQTVSSGMGVAHSADRGVDAGSIVSSVVQLGRRMEQAQPHAPVIDGSARHHKDRKIWQSELDKRIAMGHKEDDHEDEPSYSMQQSM